jgi:hypothetical protein
LEATAERIIGKFIAVKVVGQKENPKIDAKK